MVSRQRNHVVIVSRMVLRELMNELERAGLEYRLKAEAGGIG